MPIDASVYNQLQPVAPIATPNPLALIQGAAQIQDIRAQVEQRKLAGEAARQKAIDEAQVRSVFAAHGGDVDAAIEDLYKVNPRAAGPIAEQLGKTRKESFEGLKSQMDYKGKQLDFGLKVLSGMDDPEGYRAGRPMLAGMSPDLAKFLPPEYDPATTPAVLQRLGTMALTEKERHDQRQEGFKQLLGDHPIAGLSTLYRTAQNQEQWDKITQGAVAVGTKPALLAPFGATWSPEAVAHAATLGISSEKTAELAGQAATRAQTVAHQGAEETNWQATQAATAKRDAQAHADRMAALDVARARLNKTAGARPVTSADARRVGEFNSARDDLSVLADTVAPAGATGVSAQIGAALPNWVTDVTGWGTDAKQKQAVIDRVKQVIGKALEGGVLRKEDEIKYTKILPTISDPPAIVQSKLQGVDAMIAQKRQDHLDALADAGYDVAKYTARPTAPPLSERAPGATAAAAVPAPVAAALKAVGPGRHTLSDGTIWDKRPDGSIVKAQ